MPAKKDNSNKSKIYNGNNVDEQHHVDHVIVEALERTITVYIEDYDKMDQLCDKLNLDLNTCRNKNVKLEAQLEQEKVTGRDKIETMKEKFDALEHQNVLLLSIRAEAD